MTFRVGMKVVMIDGRPDRLGRPLGLTVGAVYTVSKTFLWKDIPCVRLVEAEPAATSCGWFASRFRPAVEPKQEVSFTEANPAPEDSRQWDNRRRRVVEPMPVDGWRVGV